MNTVLPGRTKIGVVIGDDIDTLDALARRLAEVTHDEGIDSSASNDIWCRSSSASATVAKITSVDYIRDDDVLYLGRPPEDSEWMRLNVGGKVFVTTVGSVALRCPDGMLARMFVSDDGSLRMRAGRVDASGAVLIDRSPVYFEPIVNYLRTGKLVLDDGVNPEG